MRSRLQDTEWPRLAQPKHAACVKGRRLCSEAASSRIECRIIHEMAFRSERPDIAPVRTSSSFAPDSSGLYRPTKDGLYETSRPMLRRSCSASAWPAALGVADNTAMLARADTVAPSFRSSFSILKHRFSALGGACKAVRAEIWHACESNLGHRNSREMKTHAITSIRAALVSVATANACIAARKSTGASWTPDIAISWRSGNRDAVGSPPPGQNLPSASAAFASTAVPMTAAAELCAPAAAALKPSRSAGAWVADTPARSTATALLAAACSSKSADAVSCARLSQQPASTACVAARPVFSRLALPVLRAVTKHAKGIAQAPTVCSAPSAGTPGVALQACRQS